MRISLLFTGWLALLLVIAMTACGTQNVGTIGGADQHQVAGVQLGGYEVIRYTPDGGADPSLNSTLDLRIEGDALVISVNDSTLTSNVLLDVKYNANSVHPVKAEFHGLLGDSTQVLSASFLEQTAGVASLGEVAIGDYTPAALSGDLATITFAPGVSRSASATGECYNQTPLGVGYVIEPTAYAPGLNNLDPVSAVAGEIDLTWYSVWARADSNQDHVVNIQDMTPLGVSFAKVIDQANFGHVAADFNNDGTVNIGDLSILGIHWGEVVDQYTVEASDNDAAAARTAVDVLLWADGTAKAGTATYPDLKTIARWWEISFTGTSDFTYAELGALDTDGDQTVRIWVTPQETSVAPASDGQEAFVDVPVVTGNDVEITGYDIQAVGATGGTGTPPDIFAGGGAGTVVANQALTLQLNSVSGTWNGAAFDEGTLPTGMEAADYDAVEAAVRAALVWTVTNAGSTTDPQARYTSDWFVPTVAYAGAGDPGAGVVCPDDDPESDAATPEGDLGVSLPTGNYTTGDITIAVGTAVNADFTFDMTTDAEADIIEGYYTGPDFLDKFGELQTGAGANNTVFLNISTWAADGSDMPAGEDCAVELKVVNGNDASGGTVALTWDDDGDQNPEKGEFYFFHNDILNANIFICNVDGFTLIQGQSYAFHFNNGTVWSTINLPAAALTTQEAPPPADLLTVPDVIDRNTAGMLYIQIFQNDPKVRRDGRIIIDMFNETANPEDAVGYADLVKPNGDDFNVYLAEKEVGGVPTLMAWPQITVYDSTSAVVPDITIPQLGGREAGRIVADITMLMLNLPPGVPGNPADEFTYTLFNYDDSEVGTGEFEFPQEPWSLSSVAGVEWGIDVGERADWAKTDFNTLCTNHALDGSTMTTPTPDVMWVRFNGNTPILDWDEYWDPTLDPNTDNVRLVLEDVEDSSTMYAPLYLNIVGVTTNNDYIAIHHFNLNDGAGYYYDWVTTFPGAGILTPNHTYTVYLDDPGTGSLDYTFSNALNVIGNNPNFP